MQIVTDSGTDYPLASNYCQDERVHIAPLAVQLGANSFEDGDEASRDRFYQELESSTVLPVTSQPSAGQLADLYRKLAHQDHDDEILSIHISSGLSGTINSAAAAAKMVPEARVTIVDTKTLSIAAGWQVDAAAHAIRAGWAKERILALLNRISQSTQTFYTLNELKFLIHGGRISHMKGLIASLLQIKPLIGVDHEAGNYIQMGQARTFPAAMKSLVNLISSFNQNHQPLRIQIGHTRNAQAAEQLQGLLDQEFKCHWLKSGPISFVLGAHTGPSMVGVCFAPQAVFAEVP